MFGKQKVGEWLYYDGEDRVRLREEYNDSGGLARSTTYKDGKLVETKDYDPPLVRPPRTY